MLDFATKLAANSREVALTDLDLLKNHGFSEEDIWDIGAITALFALSNRLANLADIRPNTEFYTLGREPHG